MIYTLYKNLWYNFYPLNYGQLVVKSFDQGWSEYFGGQHLYQKLSIYSKTLFLIHNNSLKIYLLLFVFWILILLILLFLYPNSLY